MKLSDCPDLVTLPVVVKLVRAEPCLMAGQLSPAPSGGTMARIDKAGVALSYELQLAKNQIRQENLNADLEPGPLKSELAAFLFEIRISQESFETMTQPEFERLVCRAVEIDLGEAVLDFVRKCRDEQG